MINRLIDMTPVIENKQVNNKLIDATIQDYAIAFINGLSPTQKIRFKKMLETGIECGKSVAECYGVDYREFIDEVKKQLNVN